MKRLAALFHLSLFLFTLTATAAVPIRWTVETSRAQPVAFDAYHGETLAFEAAFKAYGKDLQAAAPAALWYQTNGMGAAWWSVPATVASNTVSAVFAPASDPGASVLNCFLGGTASTYRAAFQIRFRNSPGATPNVLALPAVTYDAALFGTPTINGTNLAAWVSARAQAETDPVFAEWVRTNDFSSAGGGGGSGGIDTNAVQALIATAINDLDEAKQDKLPVDQLTSSYDITVTKADLAELANSSMSAVTDGNANNIADTYATKDELSGVSSTVDQWTTYWDGDDVRVTITNYYGSAARPSLYIEQKVADGGTNYFKTVWRELTRWTDFLTPYETFTNAVNAELTQKADRAWGFYDSSTGAYSPDGYTQISSSYILIAAGMSYQRKITTGGSVWVLTATDPTPLSGVSSNGFFRISDGEGNSLFEIVKGDKRTVGAQATAVSMDGAKLVITYNIEGSQPTLKLSTTLDNGGTWYAEDSADLTFATVEWSGSSGAWVATVTPNGTQPQMFAQATYEVGGNTYIRNSVAHSADKVVIGGVEYTVKVETVNGKKLMVLE